MFSMINKSLSIIICKRIQHNISNIGAQIKPNDRFVNNSVLRNYIELFIQILANICSVTDNYKQKFVKHSFKKILNNRNHKFQQQLNIFNIQ